MDLRYVVGYSRHMRNKNLLPAFSGILSYAHMQIHHLYNRYDLILNSLALSRDHYASLPEVEYSTTVGIPEGLRLSLEFDTRFNRQEMLQHYGGTLPEAVGSTFLVDLVSRFDAWMEDVYDAFLQRDEPEMAQEARAKRVRSAWSEPDGQSVIRTLFLVKLAIGTPSGKKSTPAMVFDRYEELRQLRHSVVHADGKLTAGHISKLGRLNANLPPDASKGNASFATLLVGPSPEVGANVRVGVVQMLVLRKWAVDTVLYFMAAFKVWD